MCSSDLEDRNHICGAGSLIVYRISPTVRQFDFEPTEEREGENGKQKEEDDVENGTCAERIQGARTCDGCYGKTQNQIDDYDAQTISNRIADTFLLIVLSTLQEETYGHRDDRPDARHYYSQESKAFFRFRESL